MILKTTFDDLPEEQIAPLKKADLITRNFIGGLSFLVTNTSRDPRFPENHFLAALAQDYAQSTIAILTLAMEAMFSVAKRELRFLLETSIKTCFVQQKDSQLSISEKLALFDKELASQRISIKNNLDMHMLPEPMRAEFSDEVGRIYGLTSSYVHLTTRQIQERIAATEAGRTAGKESAEDIEELNQLMARTYACSLTLLYHSVPDYVAGDWLVENDGSSNSWFFQKSRFIAGIDSFVDYKHERQDRLAEIQSSRSSSIEF